MHTRAVTLHTHTHTQSHSTRSHTHTHAVTLAHAHTCSHTPHAHTHTVTLHTHTHTHTCVPPSHKPTYTHRRPTQLIIETHTHTHTHIHTHTIAICIVCVPCISLHKVQEKWFHAHERCQIQVSTERKRQEAVGKATQRRDRKRLFPVTQLRQTIKAVKPDTHEDTNSFRVKSDGFDPHKLTDSGTVISHVAPDSQRKRHALPPCTIQDDIEGFSRWSRRQVFLTYTSAFLTASKNGLDCFCHPPIGRQVKLDVDVKILLSTSTFLTTTVPVFPSVGPSIQGRVRFRCRCSQPVGPVESGRPELQSNAAQQRGQGSAISVNFLLFIQLPGADPGGSGDPAPSFEAVFILVTRCRRRQNLTLNPMVEFLTTAPHPM